MLRGMSKARPTPKRSAKAAYHHGDLPRALTDAAIAIVAERGVEGLTLLEAARRVGVSHAAVYRHFADKGALLLAVAQGAFARLDARFGEALDDGASMSPRDAFLHAGRAVVRFAVDEPVAYRVMFSGIKAASMEELASATDANAFGKMLGLVRRLQTAKLLRAGEPMEHALAMWATTHGLSMLLVTNQIAWSPKTFGPLVDRVHAALLDGIGRPR